ncbi:Rz1 family lipoprotein [Enterobacter sp. RHBSTW-00901]|uniref:Rz1 family lipoprotein n=1 Tax=Enterobacter sp. RHBSTW-00901 TaxID=2742669 RepID=UPI0031F7396F
MRKTPLAICVGMSILALNGCASQLPVQACVKPPAPPAWMMQPAPDLLTPLNGIISPSESESK